MAESIESRRTRLNWKLRWILLAGLMLAVVVLAAFLSLRRSQVQVRTARAYRETITSSIATNGKLEPIDNFEAHAPIATTVKRADVLQGEWVKAGQLLLQLDDSDARAQLARAQAQVKGAEAELQAVSAGGTQEEVLTTRNALVKAQADRDAAQKNLQAMQRLIQSGAASQAEVDAAQAQLRVAEANAHSLEQKLHDRFSKPEVAHADGSTAGGACRPGRG